MEPILTVTVRLLPTGQIQLNAEGPEGNNVAAVVATLAAARDAVLQQTLQTACQNAGPVIQPANGALLAKLKGR